MLWGDVNPSGKLPHTFPNKDNEVGFTPQQYPGINLTRWVWDSTRGVSHVTVFNFYIQYGFTALRLYGP